VGTGNVEGELVSPCSRHPGAVWEADFAADGIVIVGSVGAPPLKGCRYE
jgi:hypothetical protein